MTSSRWERSLGVVGRKRKARNRATMPMGTLTKKIQRHEKLEMMAPPSTGPRIGPRSVGTPITAMTLFILSGPAVRAMMVCPTGMIIPPPSPCSTRKTMRAVAVGAMPHSAEPVMNRPSEMT